ncbi:MAG: hypothetical protein ABW043_16905 [Devosia sp.]|uniref:hypothetical protein n=1 Tax=Devosia sp. TaxID=1871048 RepID=UPI00339B1D26
MGALCNPCDEWPWAWPSNGYAFRADRRQPITIEGFIPRELPRDLAPRFATLLPFVQTDWAHYSHDLDWTLESGPEDAPSSIDIVVPYNYRWATPDSYWQPGDPAECELGTPWFVDADGVRCEVNLTAAEADRVELYIAENPPEPDYGEAQ